MPSTITLITGYYWTKEIKKIVKAYIAAKLMHTGPNTIYSELKPVISSYISVYYSKKLTHLESLNRLESLNHHSIADDEHSRVA
jgi:hypothetical protein